jgi:hypothetical protein
MIDFFKLREELTEARGKNVYRDDLEEFDTFTGLNLMDSPQFRDKKVSKDVELTFQEVQRINAASVKKMKPSEKTKLRKSLKHDEDWLKRAADAVDAYREQNWNNMEGGDRKELKKFMSTFTKHQKLILNKIKILGK